jgi:hypothetical protein
MPLVTNIFQPTLAPPSNNTPTLLMPTSTTAENPIPIEGIRFDNLFYQGKPAKNGKPGFTAGNVQVETQLKNGFGELSLLGVLPDGEFYLVREDCVANNPL